ncbi:MAG TPA: polysaccharide export protein, partial [Flavisolibacter sp.]|nr:polysaccharide export protein [Flavisolibacter sp.]
MLYSCASTQKALYFTDLKDSLLTKQVEGLEPVLQKNDVLQITVSSLNPEASATFNMVSMAAIASTSGDNHSPFGLAINGYLVNEEGYIQ